MAFKSIDLQLSVPRTPDTSIQQSQLLHKQAAEQSLLEQKASVETVQLRQRNSAIEQSAGPHIRNGEQSNDGFSQQKRQSKKQTDDGGDHSNKERHHPFKGHHIDISL